jgi:hypothetical protein
MEPRSSLWEVRGGLGLRFGADIPRMKKLKSPSHSPPPTCPSHNCWH